jgi:hypothetical protein
MWNSFMEKLLPADIIGFVVIVGGFILLYFGIDHVVGGAVIAVTTYYFVRNKKYDNTKNS